MKITRAPRLATATWTVAILALKKARAMAAVAGAADLAASGAMAVAPTKATYPGAAAAVLSRFRGFEIRGGCHGGGGGGAVDRGHGGGAIQLTAYEIIEITGMIRASGEGGESSFPSLGNHSGGGGGGSGGFIGLDAQGEIAITSTAVLGRQWRWRWPGRPVFRQPRRRRARDQYDRARVWWQLG